MPTGLASKTVRASGTVWRVVEHQYTTATRKMVDTTAKQELLEDLLEASKPQYPAGIGHLHYLLKTPFRYYPLSTRGSRFRAAGARDGVFYASEHIRTALAEMSYYRLCFFAESPATPLPRNEERLTAFTVKYKTPRALDLMAPPLNRQRKRWTDPSDYSETQRLAAEARAARIGAIRYESVRDAARGANVALLTPSAFVEPKPLTEQTWLLYLARTEASCTRASDDGPPFVFPRAQ